MILDSVSFGDIFKDSFIKNFSTNISTTTICITLMYAFLISIYVFFIYKSTTKSVIYSKKFNTTMALISIVTAGVVLSMQANIAVSLGMVGALSIVRFRTSVKEPRDLLFLFWSISNGIIIGAQVYSLALVLSIILSCAMFFYDILPEKKLPYLLVINLANDKTLEKVNNALNNNKVNYRLKSKNMSKTKISIIYEVNVKNGNELISSLSKINGIEELNLLSQDGEGQY